MSETRTCPRCRQTKDTSAFYRGRSECKACNKEWRQANRAKLAAYDHERNKAPERRRAAHKRSAKLKCSERFAERYPQKKRAHVQVRCAKDAGRLVRQPCVECGRKDSHAHHPDYSRPLDVVWLCQTHHNELHQKLRESASRQGAAS